MYTGVSGVDDGEKVIQSRTSESVAILYKKSLSSFITHDDSTNRRVCGISMTIGIFTFKILSIYKPCDNRSTIVNVEYSDCIDYIEQITNQLDCNNFICAGDSNTCFFGSNAQINCLDDFIERNNLLVIWNYVNVSVENTYCNFALNHFSCIDHFIMSRNVLDSISKHNIISDVQNPSSHNTII